jgi:hypothetical protein
MRVRDAFAYPFKVLRDVFTDLPSVPDPHLFHLSRPLRPFRSFLSQNRKP